MYVICLAIQANLSEDKDFYKTELQKSREFYNILDIFIDVSKSTYKNNPGDYIGKLIPTKIKFLSENIGKI
jgi:hypothetical protein